MHLCQQGHLVVPPSFPPSLAAPRIHAEMPIASIRNQDYPVTDRTAGQVNTNTDGKEKAEAAQSDRFGLM